MMLLTEFKAQRIWFAMGNFLHIQPYSMNEPKTYSKLKEITSNT
jgi:hypothetical protein